MICNSYTMEYSIKPWHKRWWGVPVIILSAMILFFLTASAFYLIGEIRNAKLGLNKTDFKLSGQQYDAASGDHYWLGSSKAKITVVEFGDFACPFTEQAFPTIRELSVKYKNDIKFIWRDYPVVTDYSANLALAARCAGEQGLFWLMHDKLFQNQAAIVALASQTDQADTGQKVTEQLVATANQIGANTAKFKDCLNKQKYLPQIQQDLTDGHAFGIIAGSEGGTPTYFINGYKIPGDIPRDTFIKIIEEFKK